MNTELIALASFVVITSFTPGPNNVSSASMGVLYGYRTTMPYLLGIASGFFLVMILCGWISFTLLRLIPVVENILRIIGAAYILWLAFHTLKASYTFSENKTASWGFAKGFLLQLLNPKVVVYGLTLYSAFLGWTVRNPPYLFASALALAGVGFCAVSSWALFGAAIRAHLNRPRLKRLLNLALSLLLLYSAVELSGVWDRMFPAS